MNLLQAGDFGWYISVRIAANDIPGTVEFIKEKWLKYAGQQAFEYTFLDDDFAKIHADEQRTGKLFTTFSILAIFVACLGLLGLAAYTAEQRTKEIGIRKTLGASDASILVLLSKEFTKWVIISNLIAWPVAYYLMNKWLQDFHYRIEIDYWAFLISGIVSLTVAIITVISQALKAALANPIESLKYE
jgi:putative ABC transport system permease protein